MKLFARHAIRNIWRNRDYENNITYAAYRRCVWNKGYSVASLCDIIKLNRSSYYKWLQRDQSEQEKKDAVLIDRIYTLYQPRGNTFGYRRMQINLERRFNLYCNAKRVYRVMRAMGLKSVIRKKRPHYVKSTPEITAENVLKRNFFAKHQNEKWLTDTTEF